TPRPRASSSALRGSRAGCGRTRSIPRAPRPWRAPSPRSRRARTRSHPSGERERSEHGRRHGRDERSLFTLRPAGTEFMSLDLVVAGNLLVDDIVFPAGRTGMGEAGGAALDVALSAWLGGGEG